MAIKKRTPARGYMKGREYREKLDALGLDSHNRAAKFLHVDRRTSLRRANDQIAIDWATASLLRFLVRCRITPEEFCGRIDVKTTKPKEST